MRIIHRLVLTLCLIVSLPLLPNNTQKLLNQARTLFYQNEFEKALNIYVALAKTHPNNSQLLCNIGLALQKLHRLDQAQKIYEHIFTFDPHNPRANRGASHIKIKKGKL